ncbi:MAG TPA: hypothetical protein VGF12_17920 [Roseateles sp.]|uniref:hypothetical protein n=1 Tax=Roseateles sp. TaxID=1971397 RepID=UPI002EDB430F
MVNKLLSRPAAKKAVKVALMKKRSLVAMKKASMRLARSSFVSGAGKQEEFGLIPRGVSIQVVSWPEL